MALEGISNSEVLGMIIEVALPFILVFTMVFAILQKAKIFGANSKNFNVVIAIVMGSGVIIPHILGYYPEGGDVVLIMNQALPNVSIVVVAVLMALIIIGVLGKRFELGDSSLSGWIALAAFGAVLYIFGNAAGWWQKSGEPSFLDKNPDLAVLIVVILIFAIIIYFITKEPSTKKDEETIGGRLGKLLQKPD